VAGSPFGGSVGTWRTYYVSSWTRSSRTRILLGCHRPCLRNHRWMKFPSPMNLQDEPMSPLKTYGPVVGFSSASKLHYGLIRLKPCALHPPSPGLIYRGHQVCRSTAVREHSSCSGRLVHGYCVVMASYCKCFSGSQVISDCFSKPFHLT